jgi:2-oxoglutarate dehydrogenase E1 component
MRNEDTAIVRVELLYPFPERSLKKVLERYTSAREIVWVQEEPHNMGAWSYIAPHLKRLLGERVPVHVIARPDRSSPAAGFWDIHSAEQEQLIAEATGVALKQTGGKHVR